MQVCIRDVGWILTVLFVYNCTIHTHHVSWIHALNLSAAVLQECGLEVSVVPVEALARNTAAVVEMVYGSKPTVEDEYT